MELWQAALLGIVEGLTEFIPVSSTGHLILAGRYIGVDDQNPAVKAFDVIIQGAAMLAVICLYWRDLSARVRGLLRRDPAEIKFATNVIVAITPALALAFFLGSLIKKHLFNPSSVVVALAVGGVALLIYERIDRRHRNRDGGAVTPAEADIRLSSLSVRQSLGIGLCQCLSLWPGFSRAMSTILGGRLMGLPSVDSAYFSFMLAIPVLLAATGYDILKNWHEIAAMGGDFVLALLVGSLFSFFVSYIVMKMFMRFLRTYSLEVFGWYRVALALVFWLTSL